MTKERILAIIKPWNESMLECEARMDQFAALAGQVVESPLGDAVYHVMGEYTKAVAGRIEWCEDTLSAWWTENKFGEWPMSIGFPGEAMRSITTIEALADFIAEDILRGEQ